MLTLKDARELPPGAVLKCHVVAGLELHASKSGKAWKVYYRNKAGERRRPKIGDFPALTIEIARDVARDILRRVALGEDPSAERRSALAAPTVADLGEAYLKYKANKVKPRYLVEMTRHVHKQIAPSIGSIKVPAVTTADIEKCLQDTAARKYTREATRENAQGVKIVDRKAEAPLAANRVREVLRGMFRYSIEVLKVRTENPVKPTAKNREKKRRVHIERGQFEAVFRELRALIPEYPRHVAALMVILYAGTRVTELLETRNEDLRDGVIVKTEHKTDRTGEDRLIYLPDQARRILDAMPASNSPLIFGGIDRYAVFRVWEMVRERAGVPHIQVRDFRRSFASVALSKAGVGIDQIGKLFSHGDNDTTLGYAWLMDDEARGATQRTADNLDLLAAPKKDGER